MSLREVLEAEQARLETALAPLQERAAALERELFDVRRALAALSGDVIVRRQRRSGAHLTMKEMALGLLKTQFDASGATTAELLAEIQIVYERTVKRECLSPQMSRLVDSGDVVREGKRWLLSPRHVLAACRSSTASVVQSELGRDHLEDGVAKPAADPE